MNEKEQAVEINMDKACTKCGQMGATGSGLCLECIKDNIVDWEKLVGQALAAGNKDLHNLFVEYLARIHRAYRMSGEGVSIGIKIDLEPSREVPDTIMVYANINFVESRVKAGKTSRVSAQQNLPGY